MLQKVLRYYGISFEQISNEYRQHLDTVGTLKALKENPVNAQNIMTLIKERDYWKRQAESLALAVLTDETANC